MLKSAQLFEEDPLEDTPRPEFDVQAPDFDAAMERDADTATMLARDREKRELRNALRGLAFKQPTPPTSLKNVPDIRQTPRFARPNFQPSTNPTVESAPASTSSVPLIPSGGYSPPALGEVQGGPAGELFPSENDTPLEPLDVLPEGPVSEAPPLLDQTVPEGSSGDILLPEGEEAPLEENPVEDTAFNDHIRRRLNPRRLYEQFRV